MYKKIKTKEKSTEYTNKPLNQTNENLPLKRPAEKGTADY